jgi:hypothetical protein
MTERHWWYVKQSPYLAWSFFAYHVFMILPIWRMPLWSYSWLLPAVGTWTFWGRWANGQPVDEYEKRKGSQ